MTKITLFSRVKVSFMYCLPALLACALLAYLYCGRIHEIGKNIKINCEEHDAQCILDSFENCDNFIAENQHASSNMHKNAINICEFRQKFAEDNGFLVSQIAPSEIADIDPESVPSIAANSPKAISPVNYKSNIPYFKKSVATKVAEQHCSQYEEGSYGLMLCEMNRVVDSNLVTILLFNVMAVSILVILPYFLMGDLLAKSGRLNLSYQQRFDRSNANWWLKFLVALVMGVGLIYVINPLGRGASTYYQFFISVGLENEKTLPIYIKVHEDGESMAPVLAGFLGWYLHLIGYVFTKLLYHDVISSRVYSLLFKKFIITYGIALVIPEVGFFAEGQTLAFSMFLIGLFPLSAMSMLIEAASKFGSSEKNMSGMLSQLPGISRWQILRLEEEGIDSMASLANIRPQAISENLQVIENLIHFWVDIAQLYTIVGHEAYDKIKLRCLTASAFLCKENDPEFIQSIHELEGVSEPHEIAHLLKRTFAGKLMS